MARSCMVPTPITMGGDGTIKRVERLDDAETAKRQPSQGQIIERGAYLAAKQKGNFHHNHDGYRSYSTLSCSNHQRNGEAAALASL